MAANPLVCPDCGAVVGRDRFSCRECGALLASVAGRSAHVRLAVVESPAAVEPEVETAVEPLAPEPEAVPAVESLAPEPEPVPAIAASEPEPEPMLALEPALVRAADAEFELTEPERTEPSSAAELEPPAPEGGSESTPVPESTPAPPLALVGGYLPPSASFRPAPSAPPVPAAPAAAATTPDRARGPDAHRASAIDLLLAGEPFLTPHDPAGWLIRGGAVAAALSFLLPWAASSGGVVGTGSIGYGYLDRWAIANAWYLLPLLLGLVILGLAVVPNRLALWLRNGVLGLVAGALYLGIVFVYLGGPFGGGPGVTLLGLAALMLGAGGLLAVRPDRHREPPPSV